jgi:hypothetical protein
MARPFDLAFEHGFQGGRLFVIDSNQATFSSTMGLVAPSSGSGQD